MSRESDFLARMTADATLLTILTGGVYTAGSVGPEGINRTDTPGAFDEFGYLLPVAFIRQRSHLPDGNVQDLADQVTSAFQVVEIYVYEDRGYTNIDAALARLYTLFQGHQFSDSFPVEWAGSFGRLRDEGALEGTSVVRQDWAVYDILGN